MTDDTRILLQRLADGDREAPAEVVRRSRTARCPALLVAAALLGARETDGTTAAGLLAEAGRRAATTCDRQLVALGTARLDQDDDLLGVLLADHLADHPDSPVALWIARTTPIEHTHD